MLSLYYKIWVDAIAAERAKKSKIANWKLYTLIPISALQGINLLTFFYWMKVVNRNLPLAMPVNIFYARLINGVISIVITFFIPFLIFNYLVIFNNSRYERLLTQYKTQGGKLYQKYARVSVILLIGPVIIQKMFF